MEKDLKDLLEEINYYHQSEDIDHDFFDKIKCSKEPMPGDKIELFWKDREESDKGYLFVLPHQITDEYDLCVHFNDVDNSDGIDSVNQQNYIMLNIIDSLKTSVLGKGIREHHDIKIERGHYDSCIQFSRKDSGDIKPIDFFMLGYFVGREYEK